MHRIYALILAVALAGSSSSTSGFRRTAGAAEDPLIHFKTLLAPGYATLVRMTMTPEVFACGVEVCGRANLETFIATMPATWSLDRMAMKLGDPRTEAGAHC